MSEESNAPLDVARRVLGDIDKFVEKHHVPNITTESLVGVHGVMLMLSKQALANVVLWGESVEERLNKLESRTR
jgi:hypothetical protein